VPPHLFKNHFLAAAAAAAAIRPSALVLCTDVSAMLQQQQNHVKMSTGHSHEHCGVTAPAQTQVSPSNNVHSSEH